jgi:hypothetical protein
MSDDLVLERVENLEKALASLATLPGEVADLKGRVGGLELQIVQLRTEMTEEFSAVHEEIASTRNGLLEVIESSSRATEALFQETWAQTRTLYEDVIERIKHLRH